MAAEESKSPKNESNPSKRCNQSQTPGDKHGILSPRFRSAAAMAGWDEEALLLASLVVEDTPEREPKHKRRSIMRFKTPPTNSRRKRRSQRQSPTPIAAVILSLDEEETPREVHCGLEEKREKADVVVVPEAKTQGSKGNSPEKATPSVVLPCMDRLREELSCAICLDICFEPSTTPCGHSFCKKCLKNAAAKCGKRCPKCRQLISHGRSCTVNTVLWNTIQLLFPEEVETRKKALEVTSSSSQSYKSTSRSPIRESSHNTRSSSIRTTTNNNIRSSHVARIVDRDRNLRRRASPTQLEDAALALRLQRQEFMEVFRETRGTEEISTVNTARANLRAMASRAIQIRSRNRFL